MVRFLQAFFPMVRADTSSTLSAFATVSWIAFFGYVLDFLYRPLFSTKGFFATKFFSKLRHLFHACQVPFDYSWEWHIQESVVYARTTHIGFRSALQLYVGSTGQTVLPERACQATKADSTESRSDCIL